MQIDRVKLITEMARRNLKVKEIAELAGLSRFTVTAVRGGRPCSEYTALNIARALGVDVTEIMEEVKQ